MASAIDFSPVFVHNSSQDDCGFGWDGVDYLVPAGSLTPFPKFLAEHAKKHHPKLAILEQSEVSISLKTTQEKGFASQPEEAPAPKAKKAKK